MERVEITVRGEHTAYRSPERATVHADIALEAGSAEAVHAAVARSSETVSQGVRAMHDPDHGPVTWWASDQIGTWAQRPWNKDGKLLPVVHHARVTVQVKFRDFARMSAWIGEVTPVPGLHVNRVEWALTAAHRTALVREVRMAAVRQAREKAQTYADALDLGPVHLVALADAGMLGDGLSPEGGAGGEFTRAAMVGGGAEVAFVPQDVSVAASVDARFAT